MFYSFPAVPVDFPGFQCCCSRQRVPRVSRTCLLPFLIEGVNRKEVKRDCRLVKNWGWPLPCVLPCVGRLSCLAASRMPRLALALACFGVGLLLALALLGNGLALSWLGVGLAWLGSAWLGLAWLGLAWLGLAWLDGDEQTVCQAGRRSNNTCCALRASSDIVVFLPLCLAV